MGQIALYGEHTRANVPVGTAGWMQFDGAAGPGYSAGDLLLGYLPSGRPVGYRDDRHVLVAAGTRSGKGTSFIVANILGWFGSMFVNDPKGENAILTARNSANGSRWSRSKAIPTGIFDPFNEVRTQWDDFADLKVTYNPLDLIREDQPESIDRAKMIAEAIADAEKDDAFFEPSARMAIRDLILHVATAAHYADRRNLPTVYELLVAGDADGVVLADLNRRSKSQALPSGLALLFEQMKRNRAFGGHIARSGAMFAELLEGSPRTLMSIFQTARKQMDFLASPLVAACLKTSSFALSDFKNNLKGFRFYFCLPQRYTEVQYPLLRLFTVLTLSEMERHRQQPACGYPVLMLLDEFASMRRMRSIENATAQIAGFGVKLVLVVQNLQQLKDLYKDAWETLISACGVKLFFGNDDHFTRDYASKLAGDMETSRQTSNKSYSATESSSYSNGTSTSVTVTSGSGTSSSWSPQGHSVSYSSSSSVSVTSGTTSSATRGKSNTVGHGYGETVMKRPLIAPDEVGRIFGNPLEPRVLVLIGGRQALALERRHYFKVQRLLGKYDPHPDHPLPPTLLELKTQERNAAARAAVLEAQRAEAARLAAQRRRVETERALAASFARAEARRQHELLRAQQAMSQARRRLRLKVLVFSTVVVLAGWLVVAQWQTAMATIANLSY